MLRKSPRSTPPWTASRARQGITRRSRKDREGPRALSALVRAVLARGKRPVFPCAPFPFVGRSGRPELRPGKARAPQHLGDVRRRPVVLVAVLKLWQRGANKARRWRRASVRAVVVRFLDLGDRRAENV